MSNYSIKSFFCIVVGIKMKCTAYPRKMTLTYPNHINFGVRRRRKKVESTWVCVIELSTVSSFHFYFNSFKKVLQKNQNRPVSLANVNTHFFLSFLCSLVRYTWQLPGCIFFIHIIMVTKYNCNDNVILCMDFSFHK